MPMTAANPAFGAPLERREDDRLVRGRGRYTDDLGGPAAEAAFVRAEWAHARVLDVDVSGALDVDGVDAIYTYEDLDGGVAEPMPLLRDHPGISGLRTAYALARAMVRYAGEPIAAVIASDRYVAEDAAARIRVEYEPLEPAVDVEAAAGDAANVAGAFSESTADVERALADAPHVLELRLEIERSAAMSLEARAVFARWDAGDERLLIYDTSQTPTTIRSGLARMLGIDNERVEVVAPDIGGAFGMKGMRFYTEEVIVPWAARRLGRAVRWAEDRREAFIGSNHERGQVHYVRVGFDGEGRLLALDVRFVHDTGAYLPYGLIVPLNTAAHLQGPYRIPAFRYSFQAIYTNTVPTSPYRGGGRPQGVFVIERVMDRIASFLRLDRAEVRRRNLIEPSQFPYELGVSGQDAAPISYDSGDYAAGFERLLEAAGYEEFAAVRSSEGVRVGMGIACFVEGAGLGPFEGAAVDVLADGTVTVASGLSSQGQGHQTTFAQIAADELGVDVARVQVVLGDTRRMAYGIGTFASRAAVVGGSAVKKAAHEVRERAVELAALKLEADVSDIVVADGSVSVRGAPGSAIGLGELAEMARVSPLGRDRTPGLGAVDYHTPDGWTWGFGVHAAVIGVDVATCAVRVLRYVILDDCGRVINPLVVRGQVLGAFAQGVGGALYEEIAYDNQGQIQNASFMDFLMPYATEVPRPELHHMETPSPRNELGMKGVGEAGVLPVSAALASAIEDATGVVVERMPLAPSDLFAMTR